MPRRRYRGSVTVVLTKGASSAQMGGKRLSCNSVSNPATSRSTTATKWIAPAANSSAWVSRSTSRSAGPPSRYIGVPVLKSTSKAARRTIDERSSISATRNVISAVRDCVAGQDRGGATADANPSPESQEMPGLFDLRHGGELDIMYEHTSLDPPLGQLRIQEAVDTRYVEIETLDGVSRCRNHAPSIVAGSSDEADETRSPPRTE